MPSKTMGPSDSASPYSTTFPSSMLAQVQLSNLLETNSRTVWVFPHPRTPVTSSGGSQPPSAQASMADSTRRLMTAS